MVETIIFLAHFPGRLFRLFLESGFPSVEIIETAGDFTGKLNMGHLVFTNRNKSGLVSNNVRRLQQGITQKPVGGQVLVG